MSAESPGNRQPVPTLTVRLDAGAGRYVVVGDAPAAIDAVTSLADAGIAAERLSSVEEITKPVPALVLLATGDEAADTRTAASLRQQGIPAHLAEVSGAGHPGPGLGFEAAESMIAVTARGGRAIQEDIWRRFARALPPNYARLQAWVSRHRAAVDREIPGLEARQRFWRDLLEGWVAEAVMAGQDADADEDLAHRLISLDAAVTGCVYLVGAGPGDPDLLTLRAQRVLQMADVVLYDRLVAPGVLDLAPPEAEHVYVGKRRQHHAVPQETINQMLVRFAGEGRKVVRLKGGDPFIFGRGGEEIDQLMERGIRFEVVPGVTAASGCAAYAGIPLTHRDHAQSCVFTTGHRRGDGSLQIDFEGLVRPAQTIVFYMGLTGLRALVEGLIAHGLSPQTPAALVQQGTTRNQRVVSGELDNLERLAGEARLRAPTLVIVGEVVRLRERLGWFQPRGGEGAFWAE
ncbi:uroporphyrinogen-III C-methyltransferase [Ectothiorhodospiraceae bacterium WFHF3C12]|nr:uroporphyrinogen-III C-methyltransferase [Ectothiorhodospiraceae bacterium WFHF3C12]